MLLEAPLATTRDDVATGLPSDEPEWLLVHALLSKGRRREWVQAFEHGPVRGGEAGGVAQGGEAQGGGAHDVVQAWLREAHSLPAADADLPALMHEACRRNGFGLSTPLLGIEYGGAL